MDKLNYAIAEDRKNRPAIEGTGKSSRILCSKVVKTVPDDGRNKRGRPSAWQIRAREARTKNKYREMISIQTLRVVNHKGKLPW